MDWKVLFFRDQPVSVEEHIAFGRQFGELEVHPFLPNDGNPEIVVLDTANDGPSRAERWHTDVTFREAPPDRVDSAWSHHPAGRRRHVVGRHGAGVRAARRRHQASHRTPHRNPHAAEDIRQAALARGPRTKARRVPRPAPPGGAHPPRHRPPFAVRQRSTSSTSSTTSIPTRARLLARLIALASHPTYQVRFRWRTDSFAMWDNRNTQHCAAQDFGAARRRVERVTLLGDRPFGPAHRRRARLWQVSAHDRDNRRFRRHPAV